MFTDWSVFVLCVVYVHSCSDVYIRVQSSIFADIDEKFNHFLSGAITFTSTKKGGHVTASIYLLVLLPKKSSKQVAMKYSRAVDKEPQNR